MAGDFNARIGNIQPCEEIQIADKYFENSNSLSFFDHCANDNLRRKSEDTNVNIFGRSLIEFVSSYNMIVVNGIYNNAESSLFTYLSSTGYSVVDYHTYKAQISVDGWTDISVPLKGEQSNKNTSCFSQ